MHFSVRSLRGMVTAPHHLAAQAGLGALQDGGSAAEAAVATAACLAVVYPHMTGIGGDSFWLLREPDGRVRAIDACGRAAEAATPALYAGMDQIPTRGPLAANTVAGAVSGWQLALELGGGKLPLDRLLRDAIHHAERGVPVTRGGAEIAAGKGAELGTQPGDWARVYGGVGEGELLRQPALAATLATLAHYGLDSFYSGGLASRIASDLAALSSPVAATDLARHRAIETAPLSARCLGGTLYNTPPPTQGLASLLILLIFERLAADAEAPNHIHALVEATKLAFLIRDAHVQDPDRLTFDPQALLDDASAIGELAGAIRTDRALPWPQPPSAGDTTWFAAADADGRMVSAIQSVYFEFGSGVVLPSTGICWQNRGSSFRLSGEWNALAPGRKPFHTLNPALAAFDDGRVMAYGTMGGEGQPQTQAAIFSRYAKFGMNLQQAVSAPRWLLGRTWGEDSVTLKIEAGLEPGLYDALRALGHEVEIVPYPSQMMGHAGAIVRHGDGTLEGATDPRSDGQVAAW